MKGLQGEEGSFGSFEPIFSLEPLDFSKVALTVARTLDLSDLFCFWSEIALVSYI